MATRSTSTVPFRSIKTRQFDDQLLALEAGYNSVLELALDELTQLVLQLRERIERLEEEVEPRDALEG